MRQLEVFVNDVKAGVLSELNLGRGYVFVYDESFVDEGKPPISLTLPRRHEPYEADSLFPFFINLLPEGALRKVICRERRIDEADFWVVDGHC